MVPRETSMIAPPTETENPEAEIGNGFLVRVGVHGHVGRFLLHDEAAPHRGRRVVCRTARGIEVGTTLGPVEILPKGADGRILREMRPEDELLWGHLESLSQQAQASCQEWLKNQQIDAMLLEVEPLLDGKTLYFHFLTEVPEAVQTHLDELVNVYEQKVISSKFAQLLEHGCGPGCGTPEAKNGCGTSGGCAVCKIASACKK